MAGLFLTTDLMFSSRATNAARAAGLELTVVATAESLLELAGGDSMRLVVIDLTCPDGDPAELVPQLTACNPELTIVAYGPHVMTGKLAAANEAGCHAVYTRGQFDQQMIEVLKRSL